ncbi:NAD(P)-dependent alcohol dehydrogenase [Marihabitans asiaticum]|uniref:L-iditol 2-dehydrogenase n=1 Tax=Marihabitans asiaticum TaxID=415218 RepID=A0A560WGS7_9MICO|nr:L-iditol 2-dehydrogenase [Marihabitans asiaticum]
MPSVMRAAVLRAPAELVVEERPVPRPAPGEVLVAVTAVGVCGSDTHYYRHGRIGEHVLRSPMVIGHEAGGRVVAVGEAVDPGRVGQRVSIEPGVPCFVCRWCVSGRYNLCPEMSFHATPPVDGSMQEYVAVHAAMAHPVPDTVSDVAAAMLEPLSVAIWAVRCGEVSLGDRVLVTGAGPVGLLAAQVARAAGGAVTVREPDPRRRSVAEGLGLTVQGADRSGADPTAGADRSGADPTAGADRSGADPTAGADASGADPTAAGGTPFAVLLECSGHLDAVADGLAALQPAGRAVLVGMGADEVRVPSSVLQDREVSITGTFRYAGTWPTAIELAASGQVVLDGLPVRLFDLADAADAVVAGQEDPGLVKAIVCPGGRPA